MVFLQAHVGLFYLGAIFLSVMQVEQHPGAQGNGDKKQLQLTPRQSPKTEQTQL